MKLLYFAAAVLAVISCGSKEEERVLRYRLSDSNATLSTQALYENLGRIAQKGVMYGHQHSIEYGHTWRGEENRSDVKDVTGSHAAVIGADFGDLFIKDSKKLSEKKQYLVKIIQDTYHRGGVMTFSWHLGNPIGEGNFYWKAPMENIVARLIPGGAYNDRLKKLLSDIADVARGAKTKDGSPVPVIFRPWHEFNGDWFWWGKGHCSAEEFIALWRFTVDYLRDDLGVHNLIYAFSPDCQFQDETEYLDRYPGDHYVDLLGLDDYWDFRPDGANNPELARMKLKVLTRVAEKKGKVAAFTETGLESITDYDWHTTVLLPILKDPDVKVSYVLEWRNSDQNPTHFFAPYKGHPACADFIEFYKEDYVLFEDELGDMYS